MQYLLKKKKKNPKCQKDQGPTSADNITRSKEVFSLQKFFQLFSPISFLTVFLFQSKYLKGANLRFRISSYEAQLPIYFSPFVFITQFYFDSVTWRKSNLCFHLNDLPIII